MKNSRKRVRIEENNDDSAERMETSTEPILSGRRLKHKEIAESRASHFARAQTASTPSKPLFFATLISLFNLFIY